MVTRASSWESRSNLCRMASVSLSPISCVANFAVPSSVKYKLTGNEPLTESNLFYFPFGQAKHLKHFCHYLREYIHHRRGQWDLFDISIKAPEEIPNACKEVDEGITVCICTSGSLI